MYQFHVAEDHPLYRSALLNVLNTHFPDASVSQSANLEETIDTLEHQPETDILFLDIEMPGSKDLFGLISIRKNFPEIPVVMVSAWQDKNTIARSIGHGASGYVPKSLPSNAIKQAIESVLGGDYWLPEDIQLSDLNNINAKEVDFAAKLASLTTQQYRVLCAIQEGLLNKQIASDLGITESTVKAHITAIFKKLGANNRTQAVVLLNQMMSPVEENPES